MKAIEGKRVRRRRLNRADSVCEELGKSSKDDQSSTGNKFSFIPATLFITYAAVGLYVIGKNYILYYQEQFQMPTGYGGFETYDFMFMGLSVLIQGKSGATLAYSNAFFILWIIFGYLKSLMGQWSFVAQKFVDFLLVVAGVLFFASLIVALLEVRAFAEKRVEMTRKSKDVKLLLRNDNALMQGKLINIDDDFITLYMSKHDTHVMIPKNDASLIWKPLTDTDDFSNVINSTADRATTPTAQISK